MRGRPDDPDLWGGLYDRFRGPDDPPRPPRDPGGLPSEARAALIDAGLGVLSSIRVLVDVAEEVLEARRGSPHRSSRSDPWIRSAAPPEPTQHSEGASAVRDIPLAGA